MKTHLWKYSKIDLNGSYSTLENRVLVIIQIKFQSTVLTMKSLLGFFMLEQIQELLIWLVFGMYIAFIIVENLTFQALLNTFLSILAA